MKAFLKLLIFAVFAVIGGISVVYAEELSSGTANNKADSSLMKSGIPSEATASWVIGEVKNFSFTSGGKQFYYHLEGGTTYLAVVNNFGSYPLKVTIDGHTYEDDIVPVNGSMVFSRTATTTYVLVQISSIGGYTGSGTFVANSQ